MKLREKSGGVAVSGIHGSSLPAVDATAAGEATRGDLNSQARVARYTTIMITDCTNSVFFSTLNQA